MDSPDKNLSVFLELADLSERQGQFSLRDRFLVLAADAALAEGKEEKADGLRQRLLQANPHHLLKPYRSFAQALQAPDVQTYVEDLRRKYPPGVAQGLLQTLRGKEERPAKEVPMTAPLLDLDQEEDRTLRPGASGPLKVYPLADERDVGETLAPRPKPVPRNRPVPTRESAAPQPAPRPAAFPSVPLRRASAPPPRSTPGPVSRTAPLPQSLPVSDWEKQPERTGNGGGWLGALLFAMVLLAGLALAAFTLARPIWPVPG